MVFYGHHPSETIADSYGKGETYTQAEIDTQSDTASANATQQAKNRYDGLWDDMRIPANTVSDAVSGQEPDWLQFRNGTLVPWFDEGQVMAVTFVTQMPHTWKIGTNVFPHVHWTPGTSGAGNVVWNLEYTFAVINEVFPDTTTISLTAAAPGVAYQQRITGFPEIDMSSVTKISGVFVCKLYRSTTDPADDYDDPVAFLEIDFHFQANELGSVSQFSKY